MSIYAIKQYHRELEERIHFGGTNKETAIRHAFQKLLDVYAIPQARRNNAGTCWGHLRHY